jgi:hypothetical protein
MTGFSPCLAGVIACRGYARKPADNIGEKTPGIVILLIYIRQLLTIGFFRNCVHGKD